MKYTNEYIKSSNFLSTYVWRKARMEAFLVYGNKCMCCGDQPKPWNDVVICVDHIKPRKTHPHLALEIDNLQVLCHACNHGKSNWDDTDWRSSEEDMIEYIGTLDERVEINKDIVSFYSREQDKEVKLIYINGDIDLCIYTGALAKEIETKTPLALRVLVSNLICLEDDEVLGYPRNRGAMISKERKVSARHIIKLVDLLEKSGYVTNKIGTSHKNKKYRSPSYVQPTEKFRKRFKIDCPVPLQVSWRHEDGSAVVKKIVL